MADPKDQQDKPQKSCIVCGMPLLKDEDYPEGCDPATTDYCKYCGTKDGLHPYKQMVAGMAQFIAKTQGMDEEQAKIAAKEMIDNSPAVKMGRLKVEE